VSERLPFQPPDPRLLPAPPGEAFRREHRVLLLLDLVPGLDAERRAELAQEVLLHGLDALPVVRAASVHGDREVAEFARALLHSLAPEEIGAHLAAGLAQDEAGFPLELGAALLSRLDDPNLSVRRVLAQVNALGTKAVRFIARTLEAKVDRQLLEKRLFDVIYQLGEFWRTEGFRGDQDYYDVRNTWLPQVLERHTGLPVLLAILFLALCRRVGLPACGIGLPWHFVVRLEVALEGGTGYVFIDPFHGARPLDLDDCRKLVEATGQTFDAETHLEPARPREVLMRMCHNLLGAYDHRKEAAEAERVATVLTRLAPDDPVVRLIRAERRLRRGAYRQAGEDLQVMQRLEPPAPLAQAAYALLRQIDYEHPF